MPYSRKETDHERDCKVKIAAFTLVHNERFFLPLWLKHYSKVADTIQVLDHASTDRSIEIASRHHDFEVFELDGSHLWDYWRNNTVVRQHFAELVKHYDVAIFSDADEFIVPDPDVYENLRDYIEQMTAEYVYCEGWEVAQDRETEQPLDFSSPVLAQRQRMKRYPIYDKPLIGSVAINWSEGCHHLVGDDENLTDPALKLFHLKYVDYEAAYERFSFRFPEKVSEEFVMGHLSARLVDVEPIPERFKGLL